MNHVTRKYAQWLFADFAQYKLKNSTNDPEGKLYYSNLPDGVEDTSAVLRPAGT